MLTNQCWLVFFMFLLPYCFYSFSVIIPADTTYTIVSLILCQILCLNILFCLRAFGCVALCCFVMSPVHVFCLDCPDRFADLSTFWFYFYTPNSVLSSHCIMTAAGCILNRNSLILIPYALTRQPASFSFYSVATFIRKNADLLYFLLIL